MNGRGNICDVGVIQQTGHIIALKICLVDMIFPTIRVVAVNEGILLCSWVKLKTIVELLNSEISIAFTTPVVEGLSSLLHKFRSLEDTDDNISNESLSKLMSNSGSEIADRKLQNLSVIRTDIVLSVGERHLRCSIVDCTTPDVYLFEIEYVDNCGTESVDVATNAFTFYEQNCYLRISPTESADYRKVTSTNMTAVTGAFCDAAMEILSGCDVVLASKILSEGSGEVVNERIRHSAKSIVQSQLGVKYPSNYFASKDLLLKNGYRIVYDVNSLGSKVYAYEFRDLDLSQTKFCNPTDPCLQFIRNIGVQSAITFAIEVKGSLWGVYIIQSIQRPMAPTYEQCLLLEAAAANSALRLAAIAREEFISHMSHELRTPLHGIMSALQILQSSDITEEDWSTIISCALECSQSMSTNLNDILTISKANRKVAKDKVTHVSRFCGILSSITEEFRPIAAVRSVKLETLLVTNDPITVTHEITKLDGISICGNQKDLEMHVLHGDENQVSKIFHNLVNNAIKFTPAGGSVNVRVYLARSCRTRAIWDAAVSRYTSSYVASQRELDSCKTPLNPTHNHCGWFLVLEIEDTGCGVPATCIQIMFNAFQQLSSGVSKTYQGIGLGLHIVRQLTDNLNGILGVCSTVEAGTLFFCALPVQPLPELFHSDRQTFDSNNISLCATSVSREEAKMNKFQFVSKNKKMLEDTHRLAGNDWNFEQSNVSCGYCQMTDLEPVVTSKSTKFDFEDNLVRISMIPVSEYNESTASKYSNDISSKAKSLKRNRALKFDTFCPNYYEQYGTVLRNRDSRGEIIFLLVDDSALNVSSLQRKICQAFETFTDLVVRFVSACGGCITVGANNYIILDSKYHQLAGIFMDFQTPACSGAAVIEQICAIELSKLLRQVYIVLLTTN